jgi:carbamoyltransferase
LFDRLFAAPARKPESLITQREMDLARSIQVITEEAMMKMANFVHQETGMKHLCMAGGVALNCVANGRILREGPFESIWIQPAAGDAGGAVGIALAIWHRYLGKPRASAESTGAWQSPRANSNNGFANYADGMKGSFLGPRDTEEQIESFLNRGNFPFKKYSRAELPEAGGATAGGRQHHRLTPGPDGVWTAGPGRPQHHRRSAFARDAVKVESED